MNVYLFGYLSARSLTKSSIVNTINDIVIWLDSISVESFLDSQKVDNSASINIWHDLNPHTTSKNNATSPLSTNYPTYINKAINGLPAVRFSTNDYLLYNGTPLINNNYTIFVVEQRRTSSSNYFIGNRTTQSGQNYDLRFGYSGNTSLAIAQCGNTSASSGSAISGYSTPVPKIHNIGFSSTSGKYYYYNGSQISLSGGLPTVGLNRYPNASIGYSYCGSNYYNGDIGELIIFNKYLKASERKAIEQYLAQKWQIKI